MAAPGSCINRRSLSSFKVNSVGGNAEYLKFALVMSSSKVPTARRHLPNGAAMTAEDRDKPVLLKAVELMLADPRDIKKETDSLLKRFSDENPAIESCDVRKLVVKKQISNYSYYSAFVGGATSLTGVIPGLGTAVAAFGGAATDAALSMKYQIELCMAIASAHGHDILLEDRKRVCMVVAGLGTISEFGKTYGKVEASKAFVRLTKQYLKGPLLQTVKEIFKRLGIVFAQKSVIKAIPFGVGVILGVGVNQGLTRYVGNKANDFFSAAT